MVLFNQNAQGVLAQQNDNTDSPAINSVSAQITDGKAIPENGGVVFTVERSGEYYRFRNETYGYLCSNGTGNNAFYSQTASEDADWTVEPCSGGVGGYQLESRTAKFNGWGEKFRWEKDNAITLKLYYQAAFNADIENHQGFVLEGGSIESDGKGTLFTTSQCLLAPHRNQPLDHDSIDHLLQTFFQLKRVVWLDHGNLIGDDTDGAPAVRRFLRERLPGW